ncbi:MAG: T9SS type A sorting domain-containing protein [Flavobacteriales bacterium]|nr:T9SS type A sorting domain-containing protein [Flavobacteriales bacterium]
MTVAGTYTLTVTNEEGCESTCSITVTTTPPPVCTIIGSTSFCLGEPSKLCGPEDAYSYLWSTGETTECIDVTVAGTYTLTVTNEEGCESTCSITVTTTPPPVCTIGVALSCVENATMLCAPNGDYTYLWSTGETSACINITTGGAYSVTVTNANGCSSMCSIPVTVASGPECIITGNTTFCEGELNKLCGPEDAASYLWSTGETTECIDVTQAGTYTLTVTNANECASDCIISVTVTAIGPTGDIAGPIAVATNAEVSYSIDPVPGADSYEWTLPEGWTGETTGLVINAVTDGTNSTDQLCVHAWFGDCAGPETCITVSFITGITDVDGSPWFTIMPNPSNGGFQLIPSGVHSGPIHIMVFDVLGQMVVAPMVLSGTQSTMLHMENEADGAYFLRATSGAGTKVFELLIQK